MVDDAANHKEQEMFEQFESRTNHRQLLRMTEYSAKTGWLILALGIATYLFSSSETFSYYLLGLAIAVLVASFTIGCLAERLRRQIQHMVDTHLDSN